MSGHENKSMKIAYTHNCSYSGAVIVAPFGHAFNNLFFSFPAPAPLISCTRWELADDLMMKYADGFFQEGESLGEPLGYDTWWLKAVGYENGPPPIGEHEKNVEYV